MTTPPPLKPNDLVGITCPARKITAAELAPAIALFESWGYQVKLGNTVGGECDQFSGTDDERAADMQQLLDDPQVKAIVSARGGYGNVRIVDKLDWTQFHQNPKWLVGYSDSTVLHAHLQKLGFASLHAPMPLGFLTNTPEALNSIRTALSGKALEYTVAPHEYNCLGVAEGELIGGNLSVLISISGSASDIDTKGKILFHIDRMMNQLDRSGKLEHLAGLVIGGMSDMRDNAIPFGKDAYQIIQERVAKYGYPVCYGFPAGHIDDNRTLIMGAQHKLEVASDLVSLLSVHGN
jgi:muramoyltetrapeptide carboxypeptidase